jgi:RNA polymerase sigma factor (sigma-70 family)
MHGAHRNPQKRDEMIGFGWGESGSSCSSQPINKCEPFRWPDCEEFKQRAQTDPGELIRYLLPAIKTIVWNRLHQWRTRSDMLDYEDLTQDIIVYFIENDFCRLRLYCDDRRTSPKTWLNLIIWCRINDALRQFFRRASHLSQHKHRQEPSPASPEAILVKREQENLLQMAISRLVPSDRVLFEALEQCDFETKQASSLLAANSRRISQRKSRLPIRIRSIISNLQRR